MTGFLVAPLAILEAVAAASFSVEDRLSFLAAVAVVVSLEEDPFSGLLLPVAAVVGMSSLVAGSDADDVVVVVPFSEPAMVGWYYTKPIQRYLSVCMFLFLLE